MPETPETRCRPVEVDGVTVRAYGVGEPTEVDRAVFAETLAELRRREGPGDTEADRAAAEERTARIAEMRRRARRRAETTEET